MFRTPKFWQSKNPIAISLLPLALIFKFCTFLRRMIARPIKARAKVICVGGNIAGGSGKTGVVIEICKILKQNSANFCVVTYGPGGNFRGPVLIDKTTKISEAGDEALILLNFAPTIIAKKKEQALILADELGFEYILVDDGLQNPNFQKDLTICTFNPQIPNNGLLFPAGPNREPLKSSIEKSDILITFGKNAHKKFSPSFDNEDIIAFSSIANPVLFIKSLEENGAKIVKFYEFPDHFAYNQSDLDLIFKSGEQNKYVTTLKDYVKLPLFFQKKVIIFKESIIFDQSKKLTDEILRKKN